MKRLMILLVLITVLAAYSSLQAQADTTKQPIKHGKNFVDNNGDGYNDNAPDHDGDGIPNGLDPDYKGTKAQKGKRAFVDLNGDGINDNAAQARAKRGKGGYGPSNGTGNQNVGPKDGTGNGAGDGTQSGSGNQGGQNRGKKWGKK